MEDIYEKIFEKLDELREETDAEGNTLEQEEVIEKLINYFEDTVSLDKVIRWLLNGNALKDVPEYLQFLQANQVVVIEQQPIQNPKGHNSARISIKRELLKSGVLDEHKHYIMILIPQKIKEDGEQYRDIAAKFEQESRESGDYRTFLADWSDTEIIQLLNYLIAKNEANLNYHVNFEYHAKDILGKVRERLSHLHKVFKSNKNPSLEILAKRAFEEAVANRYKISLQELLKGVY